MQVIPGIEGADEKSVREQYEKVKSLNPEGWIHFDVTDGKFSPAMNWGSPEEIGKVFDKEAKIELHLMVEDVEKVLGDWLNTRILKRVIVHLEAMSDPVFVAAKCKEYGVEPMLAIKPETEIEKLFHHKDDFHAFQILAVAPGWAGQKFDERMLDKIHWLKGKIPNVIIEVDGGVNPEVARKCYDAGASILVSTSYLQKASDPSRAYQELSI